jgi:adenylate cyclase
LLKSANEEAIAHLGKGLEVVRALPEDPGRERYELNVLMIIAPALVAVRGYAAPEVEPAYRRALELSQRLGDAEKQFSVLLGLSMFHLLKADVLLAINLAEQAADLARTHPEPGFDLAAGRQLGLVLCMHGELAEAIACFNQVTASYDAAVHGAFAFRRGGSDFGVAALATSGFSLVMHGYPDQARDRCAEGLALARKLNHPISEAYAHWVSAFVHRERREPEVALEHAAATMAIAEDQGFPQYIAWITSLRGGIFLDQGRVADAIAEIRKGIEFNHAIGARLFDPCWAAILAAAYGRNNQIDQGLVTIAEAIDHIARTEDRYGEAETHRIKGQLLLAGDSGDATAAEACFRQAIETARGQGARTLELRAATDLARLLQREGKSVEARDLLAPVHGWFTEGFDTADLKEAKTLLDEMN